MVLSSCICQLVQITNLLNEISFNIPISYIYDDNLGLLFWESNSIQEKHSKHIDICYHYIKDLIEDKQVKPYHIDRKNKYSKSICFCFYHLIANVLSKGECCKALCLVSIQPTISSSNQVVDVKIFIQVKILLILLFFYYYSFFFSSSLKYILLTKSQPYL